MSTSLPQRVSTLACCIDDCESQPRRYLRRGARDHLPRRLSPMVVIMTRDPHGRGLRRPLVTPSTPAYRTRAEKFDDLVADSAQRLADRWGTRWGKVEFGVEDVPPSDPAPWERGVPLGRVLPGEYGAPTRIVLYRRPLEQRALPAELPGLVRDILAEQVAHLLNMRPDEIDPEYGNVE